MMGAQQRTAFLAHYTENDLVLSVSLTLLVHSIVLMYVVAASVLVGRPAAVLLMGALPAPDAACR
jgi:hypothetical protein